MLRYFFEDTGDAGRNAGNKELFRGMKIMEEGERYTGQTGKYPVMNLTLKSAKQESWENAYFFIRRGIAIEFDRHRGIVEREKAKLAPEEYESYMNVAAERADEKQIRSSLSERDPEVDALGDQERELS